MLVETRKYVMKEIQGDLYTPISIYLALKGRKKILLESHAKHKESGRYSFIALNPTKEILSHLNGYTLVDKQGKHSFEVGSVIDKLKAMLPIHQEDYPFPFFGGAIGYFGYEFAFYQENIGEYLEDTLNMPDIHLMLFDTFLVFDHLKLTVTAVALDLFLEGRCPKEMNATVDGIIQDLLSPPTFKEEGEKPLLHFLPQMEKGKFIYMIDDVKKHIRQGDIFQGVLSQRFTSPFTGDPFGLYRQLRAANPSPYMFYMDFQDYIILGTSPESLVKVKEGIVTTNPIAGTMPRGNTSSEDINFAAQLLSDEKELAEHRMLVDLGRNDIGKISEVGSVKLEKYMKIEYYKHVMHIVSEVSGKLKDNIHPVDVLASCLPAGTVSGAPKIRAMQIINELEPIKRGVYAGAIGYISSTGDMDMALAIRTMIVKDQIAHVQAGAGIVYDSDPESEYNETIHKAKALLEVFK